MQRLQGSFFLTLYGKAKNLSKNLAHILRRSERERPPSWLKAFCLVSISRGERMTRILETDGQKPANYRFLQPYEEPKWP